MDRKKLLGSLMVDHAIAFANLSRGIGASRQRLAIISILHGMNVALSDPALAREMVEATVMDTAAVTATTDELIAGLHEALAEATA